MSQELTTSTGPRLLFTIRLMCKRGVWEVVWEKVMTFLPFLTASSPGSPSQRHLPPLGRRRPCSASKRQWLGAELRASQWKVQGCIHLGALWDPQETWSQAHMDSSPALPCFCCAVSAE